ncbi:MAG: AIM24 family protein [Gemmatimonadaceae bacterium]
MAIPQIHPTKISDESFGGVTYHLEGELVPVLHIELSGVPIYFEHHVLLWKHPQVDVGVKTLAGAFKRVLSGMPIFMTQAKGPGHIAFSRDGAGQILPIHLTRGQSLDVREHQFLAATDTIDFTFQRVRGFANILFSQSGLFIDTFTARADGVVWLHGYGNVFEVTLGSGEQIDVEPGGWVYKDPSVSLETEMMSLSTGFFASGGGQLVFNRFTGPGRVGIQSMYYHPPVAGEVAETAAGVGLLGAVVRAATR